MRDKELADKVVALGFGEHEGKVSGEGRYYFHDLWHANADVFVTDWRVAGALMERCVVVEMDRDEDSGFWMVGANCGRGESTSLPRAITEACVTALEGK